MGSVLGGRIRQDSAEVTSEARPHKEAIVRYAFSHFDVSMGISRISCVAVPMAWLSGMGELFITNPFFPDNRL